MYVDSRKLWEKKDNPASYTMYLQDNSEEIESGRRHPAIIVCGGGGYLGISDREKEPVALYFLNEGYQAFVLDYNTAKTGRGAYPKPVYDLAKMILTVRENAEEWNVDSKRIAIIGFSAGGHLCACAATQWQKAYLASELKITDTELLRPDAVILAYPLTDLKVQMEWGDGKKSEVISPSLDKIDQGEFMKTANEAMLGKDYTEIEIEAASPITHVTDHVPPTFLWHTATDEMVYVLNSLMFAKRLVEAGVDCEFHMFEKGVHGMSLANSQSGGGDILMDPDISIWKELASRFLRRHFGC